MGFAWSKVFWFWTPADYDVPDSATGITPRERDIVQGTWKVVRTDVKTNGVKLFLMFFEQHAEYQKLFKAFAEIPKDKLPSNGRLLGHATSVMYALNSVVDNLDDPCCLVELLHKIGSTHRPRKIEATHFQNLSNTVISFLEEVVGPSVFDARARAAWIKTLDVANSVIIKALDEENE